MTKKILKGKVKRTKSNKKMNKLGGYFKNSAYHEYYNEMYCGGYSDIQQSDIQQSDIQEGGVGECPGDTIKNKEICPNGKYFCYDIQKEKCFDKKYKASLLHPEREAQYKEREPAADEPVQPAEPESADKPAADEPSEEKDCNTITNLDDCKNPCLIFNGTTCTDESGYKMYERLEKLKQPVQPAAAPQA